MKSVVNNFLPKFVTYAKMLKAAIRIVSLAVGVNMGPPGP